MNKGQKGKIFENNFKKSCIKEHIFVERIKDSAMSYNKSAQFTTENPYDFHLYRFPNLFALELKHTKYNSMSIQTSDEEDNNKMIKYHQIQALSKASTYDGIKAGFVLSFENEEKDVEYTFYISIENFCIFLQKTGKKSINKVDILSYGGFIVNQEKIRVNYNYHIVELLDNIIR